MAKFSKEKRRLIKTEVRQIKNQIKEEKSKKGSRAEKREFERKEAFKKFQPIYLKYGRAAYLKYVPDDYSMAMLEYLMKNKRFLDVYEQFGEQAIKRAMEEIKSTDIEYETGSTLKAMLYKAKNTILKRVAPVTVATTLALPTAFALSAESEIKEDEQKYAHEIEEYIDDIKEYAQEVKSYNLTDLQNIMIVMDDMWNRIEGYGIPQIDSLAYPGLDVAEEGGVGVCRNMADDYARRMNEINPEYNARSITVYSESGEFEPADIDIKYAPEQEVELPQQEEEGIPIDTTKIFGNHAVVLMTIPEEDIELIVDPTNGGIGIYQNGQITLFNAGKENPATLETKPLGATIYGVDQFWQTPINFIKSIGFKDIEKYSQMFGVEAQNQALEEVRAIRENEFLNRIRYDIETNTATITSSKEQETQEIIRSENERD